MRSSPATPPRDAVEPPRDAVEPPRNSTDLSTGETAAPTKQECPVCLEAVGGGGADGDSAMKEVVSLSCGHQIHLSCWLPCVLPIGGGGTAQERHVEDRMGRKCGVCRGEFSQQTQRVLKTRREAVRQEERAEQRDDQLLSILREVQRRTGQDHPALADLPPDADAAALPSLDALGKQLMPMDQETLVEALTSHAVVADLAELTRELRAELQKADLAPGGEHKTLVLRLHGRKMLTIGLFSRLVKRKLLAATPGLGEHISRLLEEYDELEGRHAKAQRRSAIHAAAPALLPALGQPMRRPPPEPPPPWMAEGLAVLASMGFAPEARNRAVLLSAEGDIEAAIGILTNM